MEKLRKVLYVILGISAFILALCSILSLLRNTDSRYLKMLDFPRLQFFIGSLIAFFLLIIVSKKYKWYDFVLMVALLIGLVANGKFLINYTPIVSVDVPTVDTIKASDSHFSLFITNVKMSNRNAKPLLNLIEKKNPDIILAMEVDQWWEKQLKSIETNYPYAQYTINEEAYGMVLLSKLPLNELQVNYLQNKNVPSFKTTIGLNNGKSFHLHTVHPVPPTHFKDLPDNEGQKETELIRLGNELISRKYPTVIAGDLNDVVWSYVDVLTETEGILNDIRVGRGFYNSFNAENFFMKWPLDHVFVTEEFGLKTLERLPDIGSDHYPLYVELVL